MHSDSTHKYPLPGDTSLAIDHPDYSFSPHYLSGHSGWITHLPFAFDLVKKLKPKLLVELGTWYGDSFFTFCQSVANHSLPTLCYAVDHWEGDIQAGAANSIQYQQVSKYRDENYATFSYLVRSDFTAAATQFPDESIDLLHIDGFHSYDAVNGDFNTWFPKVKDGGVILFHDIKVRTDVIHTDFGVWKFWDEIRKSHTTFEFNHGYGLGILIKNANPEMAEWFQLITRHPLISYYSNAGQHLINRTEITKLRSELLALSIETDRIQQLLKIQTQQVESVTKESAAVSKKHEKTINEVGQYASQVLELLVNLRKNPLVRMRLHKEVIKRFQKSIKLQKTPDRMDLTNQLTALQDIINNIVNTTEELRNRDWLGKITVKQQNVDQMKAIKKKAFKFSEKAGLS